VKNSLFRDWVSASDSTDATTWRDHSSSKRDDWFLSEGDFRRALSFERKRVERSRKVLLLMLLDASALSVGQESSTLLTGILSTLSSATRETDMRGWYKTGSTIGVIFTEIGEGQKSVIGTAVCNRIMRHLESTLGAARAQHIAVSLNFFPEGEIAAPGDPDGNGASYLNVFGNGNFRKTGQALKRGIDVAGSSLALVALFPLFLLIALLIKITSKGPVLFRQERVGRRGRSFKCFKFRSMHVSNDPAIHMEYVRQFITSSRHSMPKPAPLDGVYKIKSDPRVTRVGRLLRKTSLDELPQFWNVLKGEMSLVGPRPAIPYEIECYDVWHRRRVLDVKPGITGLWQVSGRSRTSFDEMVRLDLRYARTWSVWLDFAILLKTPKAVLSGDGAF
jgi:lipopolysaccharide/colanic/teichoic acid biosynthesis glycosyltransferase